MARRGENIFKRKDGRWEARYVKSYDSSGKKKYGFVYARTYTEVKKKRNEILLKMECPKEKKPNDKILFKALCLAWLEDIHLNVKESTYVRYFDSIQNHILPYLGDVFIENIDLQMLEKVKKELLTNGRSDGKGGLSAKTVTDIFSIIKNILRYAQCHEITLNCHPEILKVKKSIPKTRILSKQELENLTDFLLKNESPTNIGILLSLYTGIRIGELCGLKWENISIDKALLEITSTLQRLPNKEAGAAKKTRLYLSRPKSSSSARIIPIPLKLFPILMRLKSNSENYLLSGSLSPVEPRTVQNRFTAIAKRLGIDNVSFHTLRHTFATFCVEMGFEIKSLSEVLGHSSVNITLNRYVHASLDMKRKNMDKLETQMLL